MDQRYLIVKGDHAGKECVMEQHYGSFADVRIPGESWPFPTIATVPIRYLEPVQGDQS